MKTFICTVPPDPSGLKQSSSQGFMKEQPFGHNLSEKLSMKFQFNDSRISYSAHGLSLAQDECKQW